MALARTKINDDPSASKKKGRNTSNNATASVTSDSIYATHDDVDERMRLHKDWKNLQMMSKAIKSS